MNPASLLAAAETLIAENRAKPKQVFLRRASSTIYYALFHTLAKSCADTLIGTSGGERDEGAWLRAYRSLEHGAIKDRCQRREFELRFSSSDIYDFGLLLVKMQVRRHDADYNPKADTFLKSEVLAELAEARQAISGFCGASNKDRRAFAAYVLLRERKI